MLSHEPESILCTRSGRPVHTTIQFEVDTDCGLSSLMNGPVPANMHDDIQLKIATQDKLLSKSK